MQNIYQRLLENTQDGVYRYDFETGEILLANQGLINILDLNCKPSDIIGVCLKDILIYIHEEKTIRSKLDETGFINNYEYHFKTLKGENRWVLHDSILGIDKETGRKVVEGIIKDITERKVSEEKIKTLNDILMAIRNIDQLITREKSPEILLKGISNHLINTGIFESAWCVLFDNTGNIALSLQVRLDEEFGLLEEILQNGELPWCCKKAIEQMKVLVWNISDHSCLKCPLISDNINKHCIVVPLKYEKRLFGIFSVISVVQKMDIIERSRILGEVANDVAFALHNREIEEERLSALEMLQLVMENIPQFIFWKDLNSVYMGCNMNFARVAGLNRPEEIIGKTDYDLPWKIEETEFYRECDRRVMDTNKPEFQIIERQFQANGKEAWVQTNKIPLHNFEGDVVGILGAYEDITERRENEEKILRLNQELEERVRERTRELTDAQEKLLRKNKLEMMGQLAGMVSHELRNPLGVISNSIFYLKMKNPAADPKIQKHFNLIENSIEKASHIVNELLDYGRTPVVNPAKIKPQLLIKHAVGEIVLPPHITLEINVSSNDCHYFADFGQMTRVLHNLVKNAVEAMPKGGKIVITTGKSGDLGCIEVEDSGEGISEMNLKKLFEPLFTTRQGGTGLGLPLCKRYVELNGGKIEVESTPGKGARFRVFLPLSYEVGENVNE